MGRCHVDKSSEHLATATISGHNEWFISIYIAAKPLQTIPALCFKIGLQMARTLLILLGSYILSFISFPSFVASFSVTPDVSILVNSVLISLTTLRIFLTVVSRSRSGLRPVKHLSSSFHAAGSPACSLSRKQTRTSSALRARALRSRPGWSRSPTPRRWPAGLARPSGRAPGVRARARRPA